MLSAKGGPYERPLLSRRCLLDTFIDSSAGESKESLGFDRRTCDAIGHFSPAPSASRNLKLLASSSRSLSLSGHNTSGAPLGQRPTIFDASRIIAASSGWLLPSRVASSMYFQNPATSCL